MFPTAASAPAFPLAAGGRRPPRRRAEPWLVAATCLAAAACGGRPPDVSGPDPAPVVTIDAPADAVCGDTCTGAVVRAGDAQLVLAGSVADPRGLPQTVSWTLSRAGTQVAQGTVPIAAGRWSYAWDTSALADDGAAYQFTATATGTAGAVGSATL